MISILCMIIAGIANAVMDANRLRYIGDGWPFADWRTSWLRKYRDWPEDKRARFPLSKSILVWLTDLWHLAQQIMLVAFCAAAVYYQPITSRPLLDAFILFVAFSLAFHVMYHFVFKKDSVRESLSQSK